MSKFECNATTSASVETATDHKTNHPYFIELDRGLLTMGVNCDVTGVIIGQGVNVMLMINPKVRTLLVNVNHWQSFCDSSFFNSGLTVIKVIDVDWIVGVA